MESRSLALEGLSIFYDLETHDFGESWLAADDTPLKLPFTAIEKLAIWSGIASIICV